MPGTLRVRSYRQRKAGARGRYSHRDLYGGADNQACRFSAACWHCRVHFPAWPLPFFVCFRHRPERNDRDDCSIRCGLWDHGAIPGRRAAPVLQDSEAVIPPMPRLTVNDVHYTVNTVARN